MSRVSRLVALNALLGAIVLGAWTMPAAVAQNAATRARGSYLMISGRSGGVSGNVLYVVDTANQELLALRYQRAGGRLEPMDYRNLAVDASTGGRGK